MGTIKEMLDNSAEYEKWSDKKHNSIIWSNQEPIYLGIITAIMFAVISYSLDILFLIIEKYFYPGLSQFIELVLRIVILLVILSLYLTWAQFLQYKKEKNRSRKG